MLVKRNKLFYLRYLFVPIVTVITICSSIVGMINYSPTTLATTGVPGNPAFDDINFYTCVLKRLDTMNAKKNSTDPIGYNGRIAEGAEVYSATDYELGLIDDLNCSGRDKADGLKITSAKGLNKLVGLVVLGLDHNKLTSVNLTHNTLLETLYLEFNQLTSLSLTTNTKLTEFLAYSNKITSLDLQNNINLEGLAISDNPLTSLDLSKNAKLENLLTGSLFGTNKSAITSLDLSKNINLKLLLITNDQVLTNLTIYVNSLGYEDFEDPLILDAPNVKVVKVVYGNSRQAYVYRVGRLVKVDPNSISNDLPSFQLALIQVALSSSLYSARIDENGWAQSIITRSVYPTSEITMTDSSGKVLAGANILKTGDLMKFLHDQESDPGHESDFTDKPISIRIAVNGDVASDGAIKLGDIIKLYRHYRKREVMTSEVLLAAGDVNSDGDITLGDAIQLYRYFRGRITIL